MTAQPNQNAVLINGQAADAIPVSDRGLAYGDGVYRTFLIQAKTPLLWSQQYQKLSADCAKLALQLPPQSQLLAEIQQLCPDHGDYVGKVMVTRGLAGRGYQIPPQFECNRIVMLSPYVAPQSRIQQGLNMFVCQLRLATQPSLAGIKHLNRLENVLARSENTDPDIHEGLLLDMQDQVIECTSGNLFARYQDQLITPALSHCGVAGVMRDWLLDNAAQFGLQAKVGELHLAQLLLADELIMTNSVLGAIQIKQIQHKIWPALSLAQQIRNLLIKQ